LKDYDISLLSETLKIYTPSGREGPLSLFLADVMKNLGFDNIRVDGINNVIGTIGDGSPSVLLCGHMDTVPGIQPVKVTDTYVFGRGSVDAKSSLVAMLLAASRFVNKKDVGKIIFSGVVDEEGNGTGIKELLKDVSTDYAIFGEPSGINNITIGYKGRVAVTITCRTPSVHASAPWMSQNAVDECMKVWDAIKAYSSERADETNRFRSLTASITKIRGGSAHNVLPGTCRITIDFRVPSHMSSIGVYRDIEEIAKKFQRDVSFPKLEVGAGDITEPFETNMNSPLVRSLNLSIYHITKKRSVLLRKTGTGDMNVFGHTLKVPAVTYGPGNPHLSHTHKEYVEIEEYLASIDVYQNAILNLNKFHNNKQTKLLK
jgi:LysW-gamma-L-lysine carboxypeptidase